MLVNHLLLAAALCCALLRADAREVVVDVTAPWPRFASTQLVETGEVLANLLTDAGAVADGISGNVAYWEYLQNVCRNSAVIDGSLGQVSAADQISLTEVAESALKAGLPASLLDLGEAMLTMGQFAASSNFYFNLYNSLTDRLSESSLDDAHCSEGRAMLVDHENERVFCDISALADQFSKLESISRSKSQFPAGGMDMSWKAALNAANDGVVWDHVFVSEVMPAFNGSLTPTSRSLALYGTLGETSFCSAWKTAQDWLSSGYVAAVSVRPSFHGQAELSNERVLQGYGALLDIKNMEYKNVDDADVEKKTEEITFRADEEVQGINFHKLLKHNPSLGKELNMLREELVSQSASEDAGENLKVWKLRDLGVQLIQRVLVPVQQSHEVNDVDSAAINAFGILEETVNDFPKHASSLSSLRVLPELRKTLEEWKASGMESALPHNALIVNGAVVSFDSNTFNIFDVLSTIKDEILKNEKMQKLLDTAQVQLRQLLSQADYDLPLTVQSIKSPVGGAGREEEVTDPIEQAKRFFVVQLERQVGTIRRVDVSKGSKHAVMFLNNLEKDPEYQRMPKSLRTLLTPSWSLHTLKRNLYTLVAVTDVFSDSGARLVLELQQLLAQSFPVRVGITFRCEDERLTGKKSPNEAFCRLFHVLKHESSIANAFEFAQQVAETVLQSSMMGMSDSSNGHGLNAQSLLQMAMDMSSKGMRQSKWNSLMESEEATHFVTNCTAFVAARNLPMNSYSMNGIVSTDSSLNANLMQLLGRDQFILSQLVRNDLLSDSLLKESKSSIFGELLKYGLSVHRYHPMLSEEKPVKYEDLSTTAALELVNSLSFIAEENDDENHVLAEPQDSLVLGAVLDRKGLSAAQHAVQLLMSQNEGSKTLSLRVPRLSIVWRLTVDEEDEDSVMSAFDQATIAALTESSAVMSMSSLRVLEKVLGETAAGGDPLKALKDALSLHPPSASSPPSILRQHDLLKSLYRESESIKSRERFAAEKLTKVQGIESRFAKIISTPVGPSEVIILLNGRPMQSEATGLHYQDIALLRDLETQKHAALAHTISAAFSTAMERSHADMQPALLNLMSNLFLSLSSSLSQSTESVDLPALAQQHVGAWPTPITLTVPSAKPNVGSESSISQLPVHVLVDPLSLTGRRVLALCRVMHSIGLGMTVTLVPPLEVREFPLQSFYRFATAAASVTGEADVADEGHGDVYVREGAIFHSLPRKHTLTLRLDVPEPWTVQKLRAKQDTDNLRCTSTNCGDLVEGDRELTRATYTLKELLVAGQCFQTTESILAESSSIDQAITMSGLPPPNGLKLNLLSYGHEQAVADTVVMQNLGYYQLRAVPGLYSLTLAAGRASDIYKVLPESSSIASALSGEVEESRTVAVKDFNEHVRRLLVAKRRDKEFESLLEGADDESNGGGDSLWSTLKSSMFGGANAKNKQKNRKAVVANGQNDRVHVFSLATGHLYERLLRIMMLSVVQQCSRPVTFWLFENYLSPSFKEIAVAMSIHYGFEVRFVTYKWPQWLTPQTVQQRVIWGYKILFLDVLFPLDLERVIYVDADQVVRADLAELWDMDLEGKPYAYTPFCTSRKETLGFQFWQQGYWKDHLQGKPYHISALYVVDLKTFRKNAVGDSLRAVYSQLSRDPNSLANLDQDLPNYAQHQVPIHSLPQQWLWCESWCSDSSKAKAKTIDLCNNPLHKESKLDMAKRVISGPLFNHSWVELDDEIKHFMSIKGLTIASD